nr:transient receptor potential gamma-3 [Apostichopus japonicus]
MSAINMSYLPADCPDDLKVISGNDGVTYVFQKLWNWINAIQTVFFLISLSAYAIAMIQLGKEKGTVYVYNSTASEMGRVTIPPRFLSSEKHLFETSRAHWALLDSVLVAELAFARLTQLFAPYQTLMPCESMDEEQLCGQTDMFDSFRSSLMTLFWVISTRNGNLLAQRCLRNSLAGEETYQRPIIYSPSVRFLWKCLRFCCNFTNKKIRKTKFKFLESADSFGEYEWSRRYHEPLNESDARQINYKGNTRHAHSTELLYYVTMFVRCHDMERTLSTSRNA